MENDEWEDVDDVRSQPKTERVSHNVVEVCVSVDPSRCVAVVCLSEELSLTPRCLWRRHSIPVPANIRFICLSNGWIHTRIFSNIIIHIKVHTHKDLDQYLFTCDCVGNGYQRTQQRNTPSNHPPRVYWIYISSENFFLCPTNDLRCDFLLAAVSNFHLSDVLKVCWEWCSPCVCIGDFLWCHLCNHPRQSCCSDQHEYAAETTSSITTPKKHLISAAPDVVALRVIHSPWSKFTQNYISCIIISNLIFYIIILTKTLIGIYDPNKNIQQYLYIRSRTKYGVAR